MVSEEGAVLSLNDRKTVGVTGFELTDPLLNHSSPVLYNSLIGFFAVVLNRLELLKRGETVKVLGVRI